MPHYMLSVHTPSASPADATSSEAQPEAPSPEQMQAHMAAIEALEADMHASDTWVFSARLTDAGSATVVRQVDGAPVLTDGPYAESKEHVAGFYMIQADDLDAALVWGDRVSATVGMPIEVRPLGDFKA